MDRTTIMLPAQLKEQAQRRAHDLGISLAELIRMAVEDALRSTGVAIPDPLFRGDTVYTGPAPHDLAARHDDYLDDET